MSTILNNFYLSVQPNTTLEELCYQLENQDLVEEFSINIYYHENIEEIFQTLSPYLRKKEKLQKLTIKIKSNNFFNFEKTLYLLKDLTSITSLNLILPKHLSDHLGVKITIGDCLQSCTNLLELDISLNFIYSKGKENMFDMLNLYQKNPNLRQLKIQMSNTPDKSDIPQLLFNGIRRLKKLERLTLEVKETSNFSYSVLDCLEEELNENFNLREFQLFFCQKTNLDSQVFYMISKILKKLLHLSSFELETQNIKQQYESTDTLEYALSQHTNLKSLKLNLQSSQNEYYLKLVKSISQNQQLSDISLDFTFQTSFTQQDDLILLGRSIEELTALSSLNLNFDYDCLLNISHLISFIGGLRTLKKLKNLSVYVTIICQNQKVLEDDIYKFHQTLSQLKQFSFSVYEDRQNSELQEEIFDQAIQQAQSLEELNFQMHLEGSWSKIQKKVKEYINIFDNKTRLKKIDLFLSNIITVDVNQQQQLIEQIGNNLELNELSLTFLNKNNYSILVQSLGECLTKLVSLQYITLIFCKKCMIEDGSFLHFISSLKEIHTLKGFELKFNADYIREETLKQFTTTFSQMNNLEFLQIENNSHVEIQKTDYQMFLNGLILPNKIENLVLISRASVVQFSQIEDLFEQISNLKALKYLSLYFSTLVANQKESVQLQKCLSKLQLLRTIEIASNSMHLFYLITLFKLIPGLKSIELSQFGIWQTMRKNIVQQSQAPSNVLSEQKSIYQETILHEIYLQTENNDLLTQDESENEVKFIYEHFILLTKLDLRILPNKFQTNQPSLDVFKHFSMIQNLKELKVRIWEGNHINEESLNLLGEALVLMPKLKLLKVQLDAIGNEIQWENSSRFFINLGKLNQLIRLDISLDFDSEFIDEQRLQEYEFTNNLWSSLSKLGNLKRLKIELKNLEMNEELIFTLTQQVLENHEKNLEHLKILLDIKDKNVYKIFMKGLFKLKYLQKIIIKETNYNSNSLLKLKKLINYKQL